MAPCQKLDSSGCCSHFLVCLCRRTKVAQEGVAPSLSSSEFITNTTFTTTPFTNTTFTELISIHHYLFKSHHMKCESLFFNLVEVFWNRVVSSKLLVQKIIFGKLSLRSVQQQSVRRLRSWQGWLAGIRRSRGGSIFCQLQHVVHPRSWTCFWHLGEFGNIVSLFSLLIEQGRWKIQVKMSPYTRRACASWTNRCNLPEQKGTPPFPLAGCDQPAACWRGGERERWGWWGMCSLLKVLVTVGSSSYCDQDCRV